jgi:hypothetical protein
VWRSLVTTSAAPASMQAVISELDSVACVNYNPLKSSSAMRTSLASCFTQKLAVWKRQPAPTASGAHPSTPCPHLTRYFKPATETVDGELFQ